MTPVVTHLPVVQPAVRPREDFSSNGAVHSVQGRCRPSPNPCKCETAEVLWGTAPALILVPHHQAPGAAPDLHCLKPAQTPPRVTFHRVAVSLRGPGQSPILPFTCCVLLAAAACVPAGVVFALAESSGWRIGVCAGCCGRRFSVFAAPLCIPVVHHLPCSVSVGTWPAG